MHIPKSDTQHTEILTFEEAQKHREESAVYDRECLDMRFSPFQR